MGYGRDTGTPKITFVCFSQLWQPLLPSVRLSAQLENELLYLLLFALVSPEPVQCVARSRHSGNVCKQLSVPQLLTCRHLIGLTQNLPGLAKGLPFTLLPQPSHPLAAQG